MVLHQEDQCFRKTRPGLGMEVLETSSQLPAEPGGGGPWAARELEVGPRVPGSARARRGSGGGARGEGGQKLGGFGPLASRPAPP